MSASAQKHLFTVIGIHKPPVNLSKQEFEAKVGNLCDSLAALPVVKKNVLSFDVIFHNSVVDAHTRGLGFQPQPCAILVLSSETLDNFIEGFQDSAVQKLLADADADFAFRSTSTAFSADAATRIGVPRSEYGSTVAERKLWVGVFKGPGPAVHPHTTQFQANANATLDEYVALPVSQKHMLSHTALTANDTIAAHLQAKGYPKAEPVMVVMIEIENWDRCTEVIEDAEIKRTTEKANQGFGFHVDSVCFGADVVKKI